MRRDGRNRAVGPTGVTNVRVDELDDSMEMSDNAVPLKGPDFAHEPRAADWPLTVPVGQIPARLAQLAALQSRLTARWLAEHDGQPPNDTGPSSEQLLSMKEVAGQLGVPVAYARALGRRGELPVVRLGPKYVRVRQSALDAWIAQREDRQHEAR